jgi:hypothetical protein
MTILYYLVALLGAAQIASTTLRLYDRINHHN